MTNSCWGGAVWGGAQEPALGAAALSGLPSPGLRERPWGHSAVGGSRQSVRGNRFW